jgi:hypothetical protein
MPLFYTHEPYTTVVSSLIDEIWRVVRSVLEIFPLEVVSEDGRVGQVRVGESAELAHAQVTAVAAAVRSGGDSLQE